VPPPANRGRCPSSGTSTRIGRHAPTHSACGPRCRSCVGPGSRHRWLPRRVLQLAGHLLVQPGLRARGLRTGGRRRPRVVGPSRAPHRRAGVRLRRRIPGLHVVRGDSGGGIGLYGSVDSHALRRVRPLWDRLRRHREEGEEPDARPVDVPSAAVRRIEFVAFVAYFGTFSIFFFTALYLQVVANASAYQTAVDFLPMAAVLILASALTGPLVARIGPRWPMTIGCLLAAAAFWWPTSCFRRKSTSQPWDGSCHWPRRHRHALGAVTSVPLTVVPPERSGMAASATNTSREMGAVFGVAILGAIVNAKLTGDLAARLKAIGIPPSFQALVEHAIQRVAPRVEERRRMPNTTRTRPSPVLPPRWSTPRTTPSARAPRGAALVGLPDPGRCSGRGADHSSQAGGELRDLARSAAGARRPPSARTAPSLCAPLCSMKMQRPAVCPAGPVGMLEADRRLA